MTFLLEVTVILVKEIDLETFFLSNPVPSANIKSNCVGVVYFVENTYNKNTYTRGIDAVKYTRIELQSFWTSKIELFNIS